MNSAWTPFLALCVLSVTLNQFCEMLVSADTVDRLLVKACWLSFIRELGRLDIWRKSFSISLGGLTFGTGITKECLYAVGYSHYFILSQIMSWTMAASYSQYRLSTHAGIPSDPVAFLEFTSCFKAVLTCPIEVVGGFSCLSDDATSSRLGIMISWSFDHGLVNIFCSISTVPGVPSEIKLLLRLSCCLD
jgi:hypothetical protein